ncbi:MAG: cAMP-binding protein [Symbiobacteriaceae bacterium]|jgi:CRP/FNR family transcriptional regulator|nr:cAMP-binding protein [Symbiobacteriaceae bacterium]
MRMGGIPSCAAGVPIFQVLPAAGMDELGQAMHHRHFAKGELVVAAGQPVAHLVVVAHGRLKQVHVSASGREQVVRVLGPGDFLGEMALFAPAVHEQDLVAAEESDCCLVPREAVQALMRRHPDVAVRLVESLAQRLAEAEQLIVDLGLRDVGQRLAAELLRVARGEAVGGPGARVTIDGPWSELAVRLGTTPESLSRRLKALAAQGLITQAGARTVIIHDLGRLRRLAES